MPTETATKGEIRVYFVVDEEEKEIKPLFMEYVHGGKQMKQWNVKVGFVGGEKKILYVKNYSIKAETKEIAALIVYNGLSLMEFRNFEILRVSENEH